MFYSCVKSISRKNSVLPIEEFSFLVLRSIICQVDAYGRLKTKESFKI